MNIGFIGSGNMSEAIISGMIAKGFQVKNLYILDVNKDRIDYMTNRYKVHSPNAEVFFSKSEVLIIAVKPQVISNVLLSYKKFIKKEHLLISIAAGITIENIAELTGIDKIIRVMPNTPALISMGISAITFRSQEIKEHEKQIVEKIMGSIGEYVWVDEQNMNGVTALSGSGPAYIYRFIEALIDGGIQVGLSRELSRKLVIETVIGSTMLLKQTNKSPKELESQVTSPGGTTVHGLDEMEKNNFSPSVIEGVKSAYLRAIELGNENK
ncbi:MAG: pyrroline-5-carboxylate reductase [Firmicutes bacterium]|nr:pyrroline-5-carboxylate reductase [Bacillota bacterium]